MIFPSTRSSVDAAAVNWAGFICARQDLVEKMAPFRNNVISIVAVRAVLAGLEESKTVLPMRKAKLVRTRTELCGWLRDRGLTYIDPQANFIMIDVGREAKPFITAMASKGVAVGRLFPPLTTMLRASIGTDRDMARFREVFWSVYQG